MSFNAARDQFRRAFNELREEFKKEFRENVEKVEKTVRDDWQRSRGEAIDLWDRARVVAQSAAKDAADLSEKVSSRVERVATDGPRVATEFATEVATEFKTEGRIALKSLQAHLVSPAFEAQLDELIRSFEAEQKFTEEQASATSAKAASDDHWFARVHASLYEDPFEKADASTTDESPLATESVEELKERRARIGSKLAFLFRHYRDEVFTAARNGAILGSTVGPKGRVVSKAAFQVAVLAGALKLGMIVGGVTYTLFIRDNGNWNLS